MTELEERPWRAWLFAMKAQINTFNWPLPCNQHIGPKPVVAAGATAGYSLPLSGMTPNALILEAGQFITVPLPSGHNRAVCLSADLLTNGAGTATAQFNGALNEIPTLGATVETAAPFIPMALVTETQGFSLSGSVSGTSFDVEEAI
jgi:hypothetical protein